MFANRLFVWEWCSAGRLPLGRWGISRIRVVVARASVTPVASSLRQRQCLTLELRLMGLAGGAGVWLWCRETLAGAGSVDGRSGATPAGRAKDPDPNRWLRSRETLAGAGSVDGRSAPITAGRAKDPDPNRHRQTYKQTYIYPYRQTDRQTYRQPYRHADGHTYRQAACDEWVICDEGANCDEWVPCDERMTYGKWMACDE